LRVVILLLIYFGKQKTTSIFDGSHIFWLNESASLVWAQALYARVLYQARVTWSPSRFIFSIVVSFFVYIFTIMCCTWLVFGWSITIFFRTCVFSIKFGGMICPTSAHSGIPILLLLCSVLYTYWGQCVIQVWGYGRTKHCPIFCYVISKNLVELKSWFVFHWWA
jgi:hypothetical protein